MPVFFYIYSHPNRPLVSPCNESTISENRIYVEPPCGSGREQVVLHREGGASRIGDGCYLVHRTRTVQGRIQEFFSVGGASIGRVWEE